MLVSAGALLLAGRGKLALTPIAQNKVHDTLDRICDQLLGFKKPLAIDEKNLWH